MRVAVAIVAGLIWSVSLASAQTPRALTLDDRAQRLTSTVEVEEECTFSPNGELVSFLRGNDLYVVDVDHRRERRPRRLTVETWDYPKPGDPNRASPCASAAATSPTGATTRPRC